MNERREINKNLAQMLKNGVIVDVTSAREAEIAQEAGAVAVMVRDRVPADVRKRGGAMRMTDPKLIKEIKRAVTIPVMAKVRVGHIVEAQILEYLGIDYIDESEEITPADDIYINKNQFKIPFVCGARDLGEALIRAGEGASMIRTKVESGTGNVIEAVRQQRAIKGAINRLKGLQKEELMMYAKEIGAPFDLVIRIHAEGKLPVVNFAAGGIVTPADAALMMQLGSEGVFVGSGIFKSSTPRKLAKAIVKATTHYNNKEVLAEVSEDLGEVMYGVEKSEVD